VREDERTRGPITRKVEKSTPLLFTGNALGHAAGQDEDEGDAESDREKTRETTKEELCPLVAAGDFEACARGELVPAP
jgi:hypothetical protein